MRLRLRFRVLFRLRRSLRLSVRVRRRARRVDEVAAESNITIEDLVASGLVGRH